MGRVKTMIRFIFFYPLYFMYTFPPCMSLFTASDTKEFTTKVSPQLLLNQVYKKESDKLFSYE